MKKHHNINLAYLDNKFKDNKGTESTIPGGTKMILKAFAFLT